jgi:hypothetical protein
MGREPVMRISTSLLALCCQSGLLATQRSEFSDYLGWKKNANSSKYFRILVGQDGIETAKSSEKR